MFAFADAEASGEDMPIELGPFKSKRAGQLDRLLNALDRFHRYLWGSTFLRGR